MRRRPRQRRPQASRRAPRRLRDRWDVVVDVHSHFFPDRFLKALLREGRTHGVGVEERDGQWIVWSSPHQSARIGPIFYDVPARLEAMDAWGIGLQALSLSPPMLYWAPPALGRELARVFNEELLVICRCLLYTSPSPRDLSTSRMPSSA